MVMIFTLVTAVQEKLNQIVDQIKTRREEEKKQKEKEAEESEKVYLKAIFFHYSLNLFFFGLVFWFLFALFLEIPVIFFLEITKIKVNFSRALLSKI